jgi:hypothetical protein
MIRFIIILVLMGTLFSCSENSKDITSNYWIKYKKNQPNYLVKFTADGKFINFNKLAQSYKYQIIQNRVIITDEKGEKQKFFIKTLTSNELKLSEISDAGSSDIDYFRKALIKDFFIDIWRKVSKGNHNVITFLPEGKGVFEEEVNGYIGKREIKYSVKPNNFISIDNQLYQFRFSEDLINLELISDKKEVISLIREK